MQLLAKITVNIIQGKGFICSDCAECVFFCFSEAKQTWLLQQAHCHIYSDAI